MNEWWTKDIREVVTLPEWQAIRSKLVGTWNLHKKENVQTLRNFLGDVSSSEDRKLRIIYNYLTGSGFRIGMINSPEIDALLAQVREEVKKRKSK